MKKGPGGPVTVRRGRPEQGVPLHAEGFPKRRCQFESVAAERRI